MYYERPQKRGKTAKAKPKSGALIKKKPKGKRRASLFAHGSPRARAKQTRISGRKNKRPLFKRELKAPKKKRHILLKALLLALALVVALSALLYVIPVSSLGSQKAPGASISLPSGYTHVLLIGIDTNSYNTSRSDTMMILSVGKGRVLLTSLQRDTGVYIEGRSGLNRLNAAYTYGGTELLLKTINQNFGLNLSLYMLVDYESFPTLIDLVGGVDIENISDAETEQINHNVRDVLWRKYYAGDMTWDEITLIYMKEELKSGGNLHLSGLQALGYARIRKTDSDYKRTSRQRQILSSALKALKKSGPITMLRFASEGIKAIETNMSLLQLISLGEKALLASETDQMRLPVNGTYTDSGGMFYGVNYSKNHDAFVDFVYGGSK